MKQVVEHLSRMFRFFPEEVPPLQYPSQADAPVEVEGDNTSRKSLELTKI